MRVLLLKRRELYAFLILGLFFVVFLQFLLGIPGLIRVSFAVVAGLVGVFLVFTSAVRWKLLSYFFFLWLILEGIFRKWILPEYENELFFVKHLLLLGPYLYVLNKGIRMPKKYYPFLGLILAYAVWGLFEVLNFRLTADFRVQILGFVTHFWFVPLIFLVPITLDTEEKIFKFLKITAYISIPIFMLGIVQYFSPSASLINTYADTDKHVALVGEYVRITGVFSYISPYNTYLGFSLMITPYLLVIRGVNKFETLVLSLALSLGLVNLVMTGSRGAVITFLIQAVPFLMFSLRGRVRIRKRIFARFAFAIPLLLIALFVTDAGEKAVSSLVERTKTVSSDVMPRLKDTYTPFKFLPEAGLVGYGIGTAYQGADRFVDDWKDMPREFEDEWERIVLELGLIGFLIVMALRVYLIFCSWKVFRRTGNYELKLIALVVLLHQLPVFLGLNIVFNYLEGIIYWSSIGLLVAVIRIDQRNSVSRLERSNAAKSFSISSQ